MLSSSLLRCRTTEKQFPSSDSCFINFNLLPLLAARNSRPDCSPSRSCGSFTMQVGDENPPSYFASVLAKPPPLNAFDAFKKARLLATPTADDRADQLTYRRQTLRTARRRRAGASSRSSSASSLRSSSGTRRASTCGARRSTSSVWTGGLLTSFSSTLTRRSRHLVTVRSARSLSPPSTRAYPFFRLSQT